MSQQPQFLPYRKIAEQFAVNNKTLRDWASRGEINFRVIDHHKRSTYLYDPESIGQNFKNYSITEYRALSEHLPRVLYARVSSKKQEPDLVRQISLLQEKYPDTETIRDIGSGLNDKRPGFRRLVERVCRREIKEIVVTYKDRITRFGFDLFEQICQEHNVLIVVLGERFRDVKNTNLSISHPDDGAEDDHELRELQDDLLSIVNVFVARKNGKRAGQLKKFRKQQKIDEENRKQDADNKTHEKTNKEQDIDHKTQESTRKTKSQRNS
jgi:predicted site-specific integrase-resolvase